EVRSLTLGWKDREIKPNEPGEDSCSFTNIRAQASVLNRSSRFRGFRHLKLPRTRLGAPRHPNRSFVRIARHSPRATPDSALTSGHPLLVTTQRWPPPPSASPFGSPSYNPLALR